MKTTVRIGKDRRAVVTPVPEGVQLSLQSNVQCLPGNWYTVATWQLEPDQAGALMFGIEQALEVGDVRAAVACLHARICAQEGECASGCTQRLGAPA